jgi:hypothetical protein
MMAIWRGNFERSIFSLFGTFMTPAAEGASRHHVAGAPRSRYFFVPLMQVMGQASEHSPQSVHFAASIAYLSPLGEIALCLQLLSHTPHPAHCDWSIENAMIHSSLR